jgi:hypothetical protein
MVQLYDRNRKYIDGAIADDPQEAVLAVSERLLRQPTSSVPGLEEVDAERVADHGDLLAAR